MYSTGNVPQADRLDLVVRIAETVAHGPVTTSEIARAFGGYTVRQGAYYRRAAEMLGLIQPFGVDRVALTEEGAHLVSLRASLRREYLRAKLITAPVFREVLHRLRTRPDGIDRTELSVFLSELVSPLAPATARRRLTTIVNWLHTVGLVEERDGRLNVAGSTSQSKARGSLV